MRGRERPKKPRPLRGAQGQGKTLNAPITDGHAVWQARTAGRYVGESFDIPSTSKEIGLDYCVGHDVEGERITAARIYFPVDTFRGRLQSVGGMRP